MASTLTKLGDLALVVTGLGDQAFINTNSFVNTLFVLKGDAAFLINVTDSSGKLSATDEQTMEKALAVQFLSHLA
jgi:hypothetical protein